MLFLPRQVKPALAGNLVQGVRFNLVENLGRSSLRGYQVVPAPRHVAGRIELQDAGGQGVAAAKIVEQPAVKPGFLEGLLDGGDAIVVHRHFLVKLRRVLSPQYPYVLALREAEASRAALRQGPMRRHPSGLHQLLREYSVASGAAPSRLPPLPILSTLRRQ